MAYLINRDFDNEVGMGNVSEQSGVNQAGANELVASGTTEDVWEGGGTYAFPSNTFATGTVTCASAVANTSSTGTITCASVVENDFASGTITCATVLENTFATGTAQCTSCIATDTVTINGLEYTGVDGAKSDNTEFSVDTSDDATATDLADSINNDVRVGTLGVCTGSATTDTVTITTDVAGVAGDATTLAQTGGTITLSGATFSGGVDADTVTVNGLTYTAVAGAKADNTEFSTDTSDDATATDLADSISNDVRVGTAGTCTATASTDTVTAVSELIGTAGNAVTLASSDGVTLAVSGATFSGGTDEDSVTVNGLQYFAVAGTKADNTQFSTDTSDDATATDLADSITNDVRVGTLASCTAVASTDEVTVTAGEIGVAGDATTLVSSDGATLAVSGAVLAGGVDNYTVTVNGLVYTAVTGAVSSYEEFSVDTGDNECATSLASSITNDTRVGTVGDLTAVAVTDTVTITTDVVGVAGNAVTLASSDESATLAVSGATFSGGAFGAITHLSQTADQSAMRGQVIEVIGLDVDWLPVTQTKALNSSLTTTAVALDTPLARVHDMRVLANVVASSPIRAHNLAEDVDYAVIAIGKNKSLMAIRTVPEGYSGVISSWYFDGGEAVTTAEPTSIEFSLMTADRDSSYTFQAECERSIPKAGSGGQHYFDTPILVGERTDIKVSATPLGEDAHVHAGFNMKIVRNDIVGRA